VTSRADRKDSFEADSLVRHLADNIGPCQGGIEANVKIAAMPPFNYACLRERFIGFPAPIKVSRTPGELVTFRAARIGLTGGKFALS
jgi:hypothetical protein